ARVLAELRHLLDKPPVTIGSLVIAVQPIAVAAGVAPLLTAEAGGQQLRRQHANFAVRIPDRSVRKVRCPGTGCGRVARRNRGTTRTAGSTRGSTATVTITRTTGRTG